MGNGAAQVTTQTHKIQEKKFSIDPGDSEEIVRASSGATPKTETPRRPVTDSESSVVDSDCIEDPQRSISIGYTTNEGRKKSLKNCNVSLFQEVILSGEIYSKPPDYFGIVSLYDGRVVVVDFEHNICRSYDSSYNHVADCTMSSRPWDICTVDADEVAVTLPDENKIQFLKIGDKIQPSGEISTRRMCISLVYLKKTELVYAGTMKDVKTYYWGTITRDGQEKSCFHIQRSSIEYSDMKIALNSYKTHAYISCYSVGTVYCFDLHGMQHFEYKVQEGGNQGFPRAIALDSENNVYVVVRNLHSIHRLSPECQLLQVIKDMIPMLPMAICFKQSGDNFLLTSSFTTTANICYSYKLN